MTIDAGLLSFEDFVHPQSIYAVLSNPKPAKFHTRREPIWRMLQSTHIRFDEEIFINFNRQRIFRHFRILIFSRIPIISVNVSIDGQHLGSALPSIDNKNLFVLPWNTSLYNDQNLHQILVEIQVR